MKNSTKNYLTASEIKEIIKDAVNEALNEHPIKNTTLLNRTTRVKTFSLYSQGYTQEEIAEKLKISVSSIEKYMKKTREILNAKNNQHALTILIKNGII